MTDYFSFMFDVNQGKLQSDILGWFVMWLEEERCEMHIRRTADKGATVNVIIPKNTAHAEVHAESIRTFLTGLHVTWSEETGVAH